ncbi:hypothetical protein PYCCODRAFT_1454387 [Trametes coccinea BRFM310]|uniref:Uncharacterized protein n=1 Tax=Trametes coccinea (strain BRFM310) TaxID=1353009 RepID=A0A1Y2IDK1_TRAC3|nr:hypothetical protein PYCCODRAFT_1454387 [Trametes coccinea BRFM310]
MSGAEAGPSSAAHEMRITTHGKITNWVRFALEHFQKYEDRPLVLHTLPASKGKMAEKADGSEGAAGAAENETAGATAAGPTAKGKKKEGLHSSMGTIPRLVSVVEIIKREYVKGVDGRLAEEGRVSGLHQYNEIGDLVGEGYVEGSGDGEQGRIESLAEALQGKNHVQQKKIAYMRVTLSRRALPELSKTGVTYQRPSVRRLSKSARSRLKKKLRKEAVVN